MILRHHSTKVVMLIIIIITALNIKFSCAEESPSKEKESTRTEKLEKQPPHIILILADDLGWNDLSFHGSPQLPTPNIDALAANSIILNNYYTEPACASARASLMTGILPIHLGLQHSLIKSGEPTGLPLTVKIMPEHFKKKGYSTYMVGKWNLGYFRKEYTPIYRGFDYFFGFYNEQIDYFDYTNFQAFGNSTIKAFYGIDLQDGVTPVKNLRGRYATELFTEKAVSLIESHNETNPLFLYMAHLAAHSGNEYMPLQAPVDLVAKNAHIQNSKRRIFAGVVSALDNSVGKIVEALNKRGFLQNSIIVFASDNGGGSSYSSNWPLRGKKLTSWEGSIRVPCFIWSTLLQLTEPRTSYQLMHISDWLPTLYKAVGGDLTDLGKIDGFNMWPSLMNNSPSPRLEVLHNIDPISGTAALRRGDYKLISGINSSGKDSWYGADLLEDMVLQSSLDDWVFRNGSIVKQIFEESNLWIVKSPDSWRNNTTVKCKQLAPNDGVCDLSKSPCLFNVAADPCEYNNLASRYPMIVRSMMIIIRTYNATAVEPLYNSTDRRGDPRCHGFSYVPWLDSEYSLNCPFLST